MFCGTEDTKKSKQLITCVSICDSVETYVNIDFHCFS